MPTFCGNHPFSSTGEIDIDVSPCVEKKHVEGIPKQKGISIFQGNDLNTWGG